jgi:hypothetical protein
LLIVIPNLLFLFESANKSNKKIALCNVFSIKNIWTSNKLLLPLYQQKRTTMAQTRKYKVGCSGSGWGIWEIATGNKVASFGRSRLSALEKWYELESWRKPAQWY